MKDRGVASIKSMYFQMLTWMRNESNNLTKYVSSIAPTHWLLISLFLIIVIRRAWIGDDVFITLRTIDNWVNGYGLTFNVSERVQAFTHPLWMLLLACFYFITREPYYTTLFLSIICGVTALILLLKDVSRSFWAGTLACLILILSNSYVDWSTSGLENPLSFLLLVIFSAKYFLIIENPKPKDIFFLSLVSSLAMVNRVDTGVIYLPLVISAWWRCVDKRDGIAHLILGQMPLVIWEIFALVYYGFPFPNTYYAKLHTGLDNPQIIAQGLVYFVDSFRFDPITLSTIFVSIILSFAVSKRRQLIPFAIGIMLYLLYILSIGGDFMSGRFFSIPLLGAAIILSQLEFKNIDLTTRGSLFAAVIFVGLLGPLPTYSTSNDSVKDLELRPTRITNERLWYSSTTGLLNQNRVTESPFYGGRRTGEEFRRLAGNNRLVVFENAIGMEGYYGGPAVHIIDLNALSDPLLARIPMVYDSFWRPGHYIRYELIEGYYDSIVTGQNQVIDSDLRTYYGYLRQITQGDIWDISRLRTIINMNLGRFDYLIDESRYKYPEVVKKTYAQVNDVASLPIDCSIAGRGIKFKENGLLIKLPTAVHHTQELTIALENEKQFEILVINSEEVVDQLLWFPGSSQGILNLDTLNIPEQTSQIGFDSLLILPLQGEPPYCLGFVELN